MVGGVKALNPAVFRMGTQEILSLPCRDGHSCQESNLAPMTQSSDRTHQGGLWDRQRRVRSIRLGRGTLGQAWGSRGAKETRRVN